MFENRFRRRDKRPALLSISMLLTLFGALNGCDRTEPPMVVVSIPPIHSLASAIMHGVGEPHLLMDGRSSPHTHSLKPSDARVLAGARLAIWVGPTFESGLKKSFSSRKNGTVLELMQSPGLSRLNFSVDHHEGHSAEKDEHLTEGIDPHVWLSPANAIAIANAIESVLLELDPENAQIYQANADDLRARISGVEEQLRGDLESYNHRRYAVLHDAYKYFAKAMDLEPALVVKSRPDLPIGVASLVTVLRKMEEHSIACLIVEPQTNTDLASELSKQAKLHVVVVDPMGAALPRGPDLYIESLKSIAHGFQECLSA